MKKQILLWGLACFLFAGSQMTFAQSKQEKQTITADNASDSVKKDAQNLINLFERDDKLSDKQKERVYIVFAAAEEKLKNIESMTDEKDKKMKKAKLQNFINDKLSGVLTKAQFKKYLHSMSR